MSKSFFIELMADLAAQDRTCIHSQYIVDSCIKKEKKAGGTIMGFKENDFTNG